MVDDAVAVDIACGQIHRLHGCGHPVDEGHKALGVEESLRRGNDRVRSAHQRNVESSIRIRGLRDNQRVVHIKELNGDGLAGDHLTGNKSGSRLGCFGGGGSHVDIHNRHIIWNVSDGLQTTLPHRDARRALHNGLSGLQAAYREGESSSAGGGFLAVTARNGENELTILRSIGG